MSWSMLPWWLNHETKHNLSPHLVKACCVMIVGRFPKNHWGSLFFEVFSFSRCGFLRCLVSLCRHPRFFWTLSFSGLSHRVGTSWSGLKRVLFMSEDHTRSSCEVLSPVFGQCLITDYVFLQLHSENCGKTNHKHHNNVWFCENTDSDGQLVDHIFDWLN